MSCLNPPILGPRPALTPQIVGNQIGHFRDNGSLETGATPVSNSVDLLAESIVLNYLALHNETANFEALEQLQAALRLPSLPRRIDCFDISTIQGAETVASMVWAIETKARVVFLLRGPKASIDRLVMMHRVPVTWRIYRLARL